MIAPNARANRDHDKEKITGHKDTVKEAVGYQVSYDHDFLSPDTCLPELGEIVMIVIIPGRLPALFHDHCADNVSPAARPCQSQ